MNPEDLCVQMVGWKAFPYKDAFMLAAEGWDYFYAVKADLHGEGQHYYRMNSSEEVLEADQSEIIDLVENHPDRITHRCPCLRIHEGKLVGIVRRPQ